MLTILLSIVIVALGLIALLWSGAVLAQGYIYDAPSEGLGWRAPASAGVLSAFLLVWLIIDYRSPNSTDTVFNFTSQRTTPFTKFWSVRKNESGEQQEILFEKHTGPNGRIEFRDEKNNNWARSSSGMMIALLVPEGAEKTKFAAEMDGNKFAPRRANQPLRYVEEGGRRYINDNDLGTTYSTSRSGLAGTVFVNLIHFVLWFLVLWLLLRFQWSHALGFAALCWLVATLVLMPYLLGRSRDAAEKKAKATVALVFVQTIV